MRFLSKGEKEFSLILKCIVFVSAILGTFLSAYAERDSFMGGKYVFMYFTIHSNISIAIICAVGSVLLLTKRQIPNFWYLIKFVGTVSITLTGIVFCFVLRPTLGPAAWNPQNILTHVIVPVVSVLDFFVTGTESNLKYKNIPFIIIPPIIYAIYAGIGYVKNWQFADGINYPYFFLNWGSPAGAFGFTSEFPFMGSAWWIFSLLIFLLCVGSLYICILNLLKKKSS